MKKKDKNFKEQQSVSTYLPKNVSDDFAPSWFSLFTQVSEKEFRKMTFTVFSILLSALSLGLLYFNYIMFGDFFSGAFLAIVVSIPLEQEKKAIIDEFKDRIINKDSPRLKATINSVFFKWINVCYISAKFLIKKSSMPFIQKLKLIWENITKFIGNLVNTILSDIIILTTITFLYISVMKNSFGIGLIIIGGYLLFDIIIRFILDVSYYIMKIINDKFIGLFDKN